MYGLLDAILNTDLRVVVLVVIATWLWSMAP